MAEKETKTVITRTIQSHSFCSKLTCITDSLLLVDKHLVVWALAARSGAGEHEAEVGAGVVAVAAGVVQRRVVPVGMDDSERARVGQAGGHLDGHAAAELVLPHDGAVVAVHPEHVALEHVESGRFLD